MKKNYTFAASLLNIIFIMILVSGKLGPFNSTRLRKCSQKCGLALVCRVGLLITSDADNVKSAILV